LAARYDFPPGALFRAVRRATAGRIENPGPLDFESLSRACRAVGTARMGVIAQRLAQPYTRADLVLPADLLAELDLAGAWMRHRRRVFEDWGFGRRMALGRGLTALFSGEPGTGKTMAAQVLARELGLDLFRVDLSRVMSKYIGETEKNLAQLFDDARASGAILFFDEADALFGKRTEVKDAHDRYANLEIGYLLQRMEEHAGVTVLATNRLGDLDQAFTRRFHFILEFPMPQAVERRRIWEGLLPREAALASGLDLEALARDYELSGGEIRNSVLSAAFIAAEEGAPIGLRHLKRGLRRELLKTGRILDSRQRRALDGDQG
jgi:SpoVK/Ycf46/Vps4 family AAA+-type ATPase